MEEGNILPFTFISFETFLSNFSHVPFDTRVPFFFDFITAENFFEISFFASMSLESSLCFDISVLSDGSPPLDFLIQSTDPF